MKDKNTIISELCDQIASLITELETWKTLHEVQDALGLPYDDPSGEGKYKYLRRITELADEKSLLSSAHLILNRYPGLCSKPSPENKAKIQDLVWWIENNGNQIFSNAARYQIIEELEGTQFWGRFSICSFFEAVAPYLRDLFSIKKIKPGPDGYIYTNYHAIQPGVEAYKTWFPNQASQTSFSYQPSYSSKPQRISLVKYLQKAGVSEWPDQRFFKFIEKAVDPEIHSAESQSLLFQKLNHLLQKDGFELYISNQQGGLPVYEVRLQSHGVTGSPKYIIFAPLGAKPDRVIDDAVNMNIRIEQNADQCLVYDQPPPANDLTWEILVKWWCDLNGVSATDSSSRQTFGQRLIDSLQSEAERMFFRTYFKRLKPTLKENLPALLPQVYLHYDPRSQKSRTQPVLARQRMDFLLLLRNGVRVVIEIDGLHHYSDQHNKPSARRYAEMVAEDRRIKLLGYEVYRFGGIEIVTSHNQKWKIQDNAEQIITNFFEELFVRHGIITQT